MSSKNSDKEKYYARLRHQMVETQIRNRGVTNPVVLKAMRNVPRHLFVPESVRSQAYDDHPLPIGHGQTISQPYMVAFMTEALAPRTGMKVLEIGTGSGYQTAVLLEAGAEVYSIERVQELAEKAKKQLEALGYSRFYIRVGDGTLGWPEAAPFDGIIVTAGAPEIPQPLVNQLADGGRLVIPVGDRMGQDLLLVEKREGQVFIQNLGGCVFVKLIGKHGWSQ